MNGVSAARQQGAHPAVPEVPVDNAWPPRALLCKEGDLSEALEPITEPRLNTGAHLFSPRAIALVNKDEQLTGPT